MNKFNNHGGSFHQSVEDKSLILLHLTWCGKKSLKESWKVNLRIVDENTPMRTWRDKNREKKTVGQVSITSCWSTFKLSRFNVTTSLHFPKYSIPWSLDRIHIEFLRKPSGIPSRYQARFYTIRGWCGTWTPSEETSLRQMDSTLI
jgi:hypothetical protein